MAKRLAAVAAAVLLIAFAVVIRRGLDGESIVSGGEPVVVCDELIAEACRRSLGEGELRVESPGATLRRIAGEDVEPFVWITASSWADMGRSELARAGRSTDLAVDADLRAATEIVTVAIPGLDLGCRSLDWACLAEATDADIAAPSTDSTVGLLARAQGAAAANGSGQFALQDLRRIAPQWTVEDDAAGILSTRPGQLDVAVADAVTAGRIARSVEISVPADSRAIIDLVAISVDGASVGGLDGLERALEADGWSDSVAPALDDPLSVNGLLALWAG